MEEVTANIRAFPWGSLERVASGEVRSMAALRRMLAGYVAEGAVAGALSGVVGLPIAAHSRRVHTAPLSRLTGPEGVAVLFGDADTDQPRFVVEAEIALALALVGGALKQGRAPRVVDASRPPSPKLAGALAAVLVAALRRAYGEQPLRVLEAGPSSVVMRALANAGGTLHVASLSVLVGDDAFLGKIVVASSAANGLAPPPWESRHLASLGDAPLAIPVVACATLASRESITLLTAGDAWMPGAGALVRSPSGALHGPVILAAPTSERGVRATLGIDGRLVLRGEGEELGMADENAALVENLGEVPVVVRVEIGTAQMRAREWAELRTGDVVALGRRIAEPVTLRVGGVEVARGELVEIEGEVGVRIVSRVAETR
ncbi:MAG: FliM/FliN family flagellar motor switch protein [Polyangiaceae bacterium]